MPVDADPAHLDLGEVVILVSVGVGTEGAVRHPIRADDVGELVAAAGGVTSQDVSEEQHLLQLDQYLPVASLADVDGGLLARAEDVRHEEGRVARYGLLAQDGGKSCRRTAESGDANLSTRGRAIFLLIIPR